jgi:plastocyanin
MTKSHEIMALSAMALWLGLSNAAARAEGGATINIQTFQFQPKEIEVKAGMPVTWINQDDIRHTVTSGTPENKDGRFDAPLAGKGAKFTFTFAQPGTYAFFCDRHQHMRGEIVVK